MNANSIPFLKLNGYNARIDYLKEIYNFCKCLYDTKYIFTKEKKNYLRFASLLRHLNINKDLFSKNLRYENPNIYDDGSLIPNVKLNELLNTYDNDENVEKFLKHISTYTLKKSK